MLRSGDIPTIAPQNAKPLLSDEASAYKLLDVRPMWEREKAYVAGSIHVPLFVEDEATDAVTLLKKQIQFGFGGAWLGQRFTKPNDSFLAQVEEAIPSKNEKIIVACGEGMRLVS
jgi:rhodanese-related sulfurtransferase